MGIKKYAQKSAAFIIIFAMVSGFVPSLPVAAADISVFVTGAYIDAVKNAAYGDTITVTGQAAPAEPAKLEIPSGVTVVWEAVYTGSLDRARYLLTLSGEGTFKLNGEISNGAGGALNVTGEGLTVNINGRLSADSPSAVALNIAANKVKVNINGGIMTSGGASSNINVASGCEDVTINVFGGEVLSVPNGNVINDSGQNTAIKITGGTLTSEKASAIKSTGDRSAVEISGGTISNAAGNNLTPAIDMQGNMGGTFEVNIKVGQNGIVRSTSQNGYALQTKGSVEISDNAQITAVNGRAVNLVGEYSAAYIKGGTVKTTGNGTAVSSATTPGVDVTNTKIIIEGGLVCSEGGNAVNITGANSELTISGGQIKAGAGNAVNAENTALNSKITIKGGEVTAESGLAVKTPNTIIISGGFVFAYGKSIGEVVSAAKSTFPANFPTSDGIVAAWNKPGTAHPVYTENTVENLTVLPAGSVKWAQNTGGGAWDGINYSKGATSGFFMLDKVIVHSAGLQPDGLIFNIADGEFYIGSVGAGKELGHLKYSWSWSGGVLTLENFRWMTYSPVALTVLGGENITINPVGINSFIAAEAKDTSTGILIKNTGILSFANITITGNGAIDASASDGVGIDMGGRTLKMEECTSIITASGEGEAINNTNPILPGGYTYKTAANPDGTSAKTFSVVPAPSPGGAAYKYSAGNKYVQIQAHKPHELKPKDAFIISPARSGNKYFWGEIVSIQEIPAQYQLPSPYNAVISPALGHITSTQGPAQSYPSKIEVFKAWKSDNGGIFENENSKSTKFTMPDNDAAVTAERQTAHKLWVDGGGFIFVPDQSNPQNSVGNPALGYYLPGDEIPLKPIGQIPDTQYFGGWVAVPEKSSASVVFYTYEPTGDEFENPNYGYTKLTMPDRDIIITGSILSKENLNKERYDLTVITSGAPGTVISNILPGTTEILSAEIPAGMAFERWEWKFDVPPLPPATPYTGAFVNDRIAIGAQFIMGEGNITVTAVYKKITYNLAVVNGTIKGVVISGKLDTEKTGPAFAEGDIISIEPDPPDSPRREFYGWDIKTNGSFNENGLFVMPASATQVAAKYDTVYLLTVIGGTGSGLYRKNEKIEITAEAENGVFGIGPVSDLKGFLPRECPLFIKAFESWKSGGGGSFENADLISTNFTMPESDVIITGTQTAYKLWVSKDGYIDNSENDPDIKLGYYPPGTEVFLTAVFPGTENDYYFEGWSAETSRGSSLPEPYTYETTNLEFSHPNSVFTKLTMPERNIIITANWLENNAGGNELDHNPHTLTIVNGKGSVSDGGEQESVLTIPAGTWVTITADESSEGCEFFYWKIIGDATNGSYKGSFINITEKKTTFMMGESDMTVFAKYKYKLTVINGAGGGLYAEGDKVKITADPRPGYNFTGWRVISGGAVPANPSSPETAFIMPANISVIEACYTKIISVYTPDPFLPDTNTSAPDPKTDAAKGSDTAGESEKAPDKPADQDQKFTKEHISYIKGRGENMFAPGENIKRAETAQMFFNLLSGGRVKKSKTFPDVPNGAWYEQAVCALAAEGFLLGFPDGTFRPEAGITRAEFAAIVVRIEANSEFSAAPNKFTDVPNSHWAYEYINTAADKGWILGYENGSYKPDSPITRAEAVTLLNRVLGRAADKEYIASHSELPGFSDVPQSYWAYFDIAEAHTAHLYEISENCEKWKEILSE